MREITHLTVIKKRNFNLLHFYKCLLCSLCLIGSISLLAQEQKSQRVTLSYKRVSLHVVLEEIGKQTGFGFSYSTQTGLISPVTIDVTNVPLDKVIETLSLQLDVNFKRVNKMYAVETQNS